MVKKIAAYILVCFFTMVGALAGAEHQCGEDPPVYAGAVGASLVWPLFLPWAASKNGSPLWKCSDKSREFLVK